MVPCLRVLRQNFDFEMKKIALFLMLILAPLHLCAQDETLADIQGKAEAGDGAALLRLSKVYADGEFGVEPDNRTAHIYMMRAVEAGNPYAYYELAKRYKDDPWMILEPNEAERRLWLERAAAENHVEAIDFLVPYADNNIARLGLYLKALKVTPLEGTESAVALIRSKLFKVIGNSGYFENPDAPEYIEAVEYVRGLGNDGDVQAQLALGTVYNNIYKDYPKARFWYQKAADQGSYRGHYNLAVAYNNKESSVYDPAKAVEHLKVAAEGGDADAQYWLGASYNPQAPELYKVGKDIMLSIEWYERAANQGHKNAQFHGGVQIINTAKEIRKKKQAYAIGAHGIRLLEMAYEDGDLEAAWLLSLAHSLGYGTRPNSTLANKYLVIAARGGHQKAIEHCQKFNKKY